MHQMLNYQIKEKKLLISVFCCNKAKDKLSVSQSDLIGFKQNKSALKCPNNTAVLDWYFYFY